MIILKLNKKTDEYTYGTHQLQIPVQTAYSYERVNKTSSSVTGGEFLHQIRNF